MLYYFSVATSHEYRTKSQGLNACSEVSDQHLLVPLPNLDNDTW